MAEPSMNGEQVATELKSLLDYVHDCDRRVHMGEIMDLQGLDRKVIVLCDAIAHLPQKDALVLEDRMGELIDSLEKLADTMRTQQDKMGGGAN